MDSESFAPDINALLEPVSADARSGPSIRYENAFLALRQSREEDDPSTPMGDWDRPLRKADWKAVARNCEAMLARSKDLQIAAWLCDAWLRQEQVAGLHAGVQLLHGLVERFWDDVHPRIEDGDSEARVAPFAWLNENLPVVLRLSVPLMYLDRQPGVLSLTEWENVVTPQPSRERHREVPFSRELLVGLVDARNLRWLKRLQSDIAVTLTAWEALDKALDDRLGSQAPSLGKVADTLRRMQRAATGLLDGRGEPQPAAAPTPVPGPDPAMTEEPAMSADTPEPAADPAPVTAGAIRNRADAYRMLETAAAYLQRTEPHSPTPYLVKRAVQWGQMSLPDLMQEVLREEGDLGRFFSMIGVPKE